jgi:hypothetical protein
MLLVFLSASLACSTRLDPTIAVGAVDAGTDGEPEAAASDCVQMTAGASSYWVCLGPLASRDAASADCAGRGAELAAVSSAEENAFLAAAAADLGTHSNLWLGGIRDDEHVWRWPDTTVFWRGLVDGQAEPDTYVNWQSGEPNDDSTVTDEPERCAALALYDSGWRDRACSLELSYLCELPATSP